VRRAAIVSPLRTPVGAFGGALRDLPVEDLAAAVVRATVTGSGIDPERIDDVVFAHSYANSEVPCVGRWVALHAGLPTAVPGISVPETTQGTTLGNLGFSDVKFPKPVFHGDTIRVRAEIVDMRESKSRQDSGIVYFRHLGINQRDEVVCDAQRTGLMLKRPTSYERSAS
jgi:hypothetical protein